MATRLTLTFRLARLAGLDLVKHSAELHSILHCGFLLGLPSGASFLGLGRPYLSDSFLPVLVRDFFWTSGIKGLSASGRNWAHWTL